VWRVRGRVHGGTIEHGDFVLSKMQRQSKLNAVLFAGPVA